MENVTDALYIAFAVLAFVIALSVSIFAFSEVSAASQNIIYSIDKEVTYKYINPENTTGTNRIVTSEEIIPALFKACKENYIIKFEGIEDLMTIKTVKKAEDGTIEKIETHTSTINFDCFSEPREELIKDILRGQTVDNEYLEIKYDEIIDSTLLRSSGLYGIIEGKTFEEHVGIYNTNADKDDEANKTERRILTYSLKE